jgi:hypothetical protein
MHPDVGSYQYLDNMGSDPPKMMPCLPLGVSIHSGFGGW